MKEIGLKWQFRPIIFLITLISLSCSKRIDRVDAGALDVRKIGFNGTWNEFCDSKKIEEEFVGYMDHDLKRMRILICRLRNQNRISRETMPALVAYKYCAMIRTNLEDLFCQLIDKFDLRNRTLTEEDALVKFLSGDEDNECLEKSTNVFQKQCIGKENPCVKMFQTMLHIACTTPHISKNDIHYHLEEVCAGKYISDNIDWNTLMASINFTKT